MSYAYNKSQSQSKYLPSGAHTFHNVKHTFVYFKLFMNMNNIYLSIEFYNACKMYHNHVFSAMWVTRIDIMLYVPVFSELNMLVIQNLPGSYTIIKEDVG